MNKLFLAFCLVTILLAACGPSDSALKVTVQAAIAQTQAAQQPSYTPEPYSTRTPNITDTPKPTATEIITETPWPTRTSVPSETFTPQPKPIVLAGKGSDVVDIRKWDGPALLKVTHKGDGNFIIYNYNSAGDKISLLINTIGNYEGIRPIDFRVNQKTSRLEIRSIGTWEITINPLIFVDVYSIPGIASGKGDSVFAIKPSIADLAKVSYQGNSNFIIYGYTETRVNLLVNEINSWNGTIIIPATTWLYEVKADGNWTIEFTAK